MKSKVWKVLHSLQHYYTRKKQLAKMKARNTHTPNKQLRIQSNPMKEHTTIARAPK